jgi:sugar lactone lactonase YvrE
MLQIVTTMNHKSMLAALVGLFSLFSLSAAAEYRVETLTPPAALHGANGMHFDADGNLIVGSMMSGTISKINIQSGHVETIVPSPLGIADDLAIGPDGQVVWTVMPMGFVHTLEPGGKVRKIATGLPLINSIYFTRDGRLFAAQVTEGDGDLYELDPTGQQPPRVALKDLAGLNGFEITDDDILYGPLMNAGKVVRIDLNTMEMTEVADGFTRPVAVNLDSAGQLYVVDLVTGEVTRVDPDSGAKTVIARRVPPIDNLAISEDDLIYVSHPCETGIEEINPATGAVRQVVAGSIGLPGAGIIRQHEGRETLVIPGMLCQNIIDTETGAVSLLPRTGDIIWASWLDWVDDVVVLSSFAFGQLQWLDAGTGEPFRTLSGFKNPYAIKIMADDSLMVAEYGSGRLLKLHAPFTGEPEVIAEELGGPLDFTISNDKTIYVTEAAAGRVSAISPDDGKRRVIRENMQQPEGIAELDDGRLVVAEVGARRIVAISTDSDELEVIADNLPIGMPPFMGPPKTFLPTGVLVGQNGIIYVATDMTHTVLKISPLH